MFNLQLVLSVLCCSGDSTTLPAGLHLPDQGAARLDYASANVTNRGFD